MEREKRAILHILSSGEIGGIETLCMTYAKYSQNNNIFLFPWKTGIITETMEKNGAKVIKFNASQKKFMSTYAKIIDVCKQNHVRSVVIHHIAPALLLYIPFLKKRFPYMKVYMYAHANAENMFWKSNYIKYFYYKPIVIWAARYMDKIISISEYVKSTVVDEMNLTSEKIEVIYNGVDIRRFQSENLNESNIEKLVYVGRLVKEKGVDNIIRAVSLLPKKLQWHLTIVGDGPERQMLENLVLKLGMNGRVTFVGNCTNVPQVLEKSGVFLHLPNCEEGFGITVIEAMASGLVCICGASGGIPEIISNNENGFLVEKRNEREMAKCIRNLLTNEEKLRIDKLKKAAVNRAADFSIDIFVEKLDKTVI